jgi:regulator of sigma E protease
LFFDAWGFKLFKFNYKGCEYGIGWLPLGGYVKIAGMIDESMDTEQMKQEPQSWEFRSKPAWQRLIVMLGGVTVNVILGIFIFWMLTFFNGESFVPNSEAKHGIVAYELAQEIGLKSGDKVLSVNGKPIVRYNQLWSSEVIFGASVLEVQRGDEKLEVRVPKDFIEKLSDKGRTNYIDDFPRMQIVLDTVIAGSNAEKATLKKGDQIVSVNGNAILYMDELKPVLKDSANKTIELGVIRSNDTIMLKALVTSEGTLGFAPVVDFKLETIQYGLFESLPIGASKAITTLTDNVKGLGKVVKGEVAATKAVQGPIGIASIYGATFNWTKFWTLTAILSMILAFMNILPIPALDGGHSVFLLIEMAIGRPLSDKFMEKAQMVGFVILVALMVFAFGNDIWNGTFNTFATASTTQSKAIYENQIPPDFKSNVTDNEYIVL